MNEEEAVARVEKYIKSFNGNALDCVAIGTVLTLLEKKDNVIDEMAKKINEAYFESGDFEEWFENKICKVQRYEDYTYLEKDIKQYFERKVENGN